MSAVQEAAGLPPQQRVTPACAPAAGAWAATRAPSVAAWQPQVVVSCAPGGHRWGPRLPLGAVELAPCAASTPEDLARMEDVYAHHDEPYPAAWLRANGWDWAAEIFNEQLGGKAREEAPPAAAAGRGELGLLVGAAAPGEL